MTTHAQDIAILRDLARQAAEIARKPIQDERRDLWRKHNSLVRTRPLIYVRAFAWGEIFPDSSLRCQDPFFRAYERHFHEVLYRDSLGDDYIIEPWVTVSASYLHPAKGRMHRWGPEIRTIPSPHTRGAWMFDPPLKQPEDIATLVKPVHAIDEEATARRVARLQDAIGDIIEVSVDRGPYYRMWTADLSTDLAYLRGLEQFMWDMVDRPEWLHRLVGFMRDGVLEVHAQAEAAGDWRLCDHQNQAMPYALELEDPKANSAPVTRKQLWCFAASQEFAQVSPAMHNEFLLQYQISILQHFGLVAYGCCEDLTRKIPYLKQIPNLRRIAVTPWADVRSCAEQIGQDYVLSWRPSPADMVSYNWDPDKVRTIVRGAMEICKEYGSHVDITLKDVETVQGDAQRVPQWVQIVRGIVEDYA